MHMLFKVCCILMRNAKVNMGQVALCQKSGQWRIRNFSGLTFLRSKAQARSSYLCCICFKINVYSYKSHHNKTNETIIVIPESLRLENTLKAISVPTPAMGRDQVTPRPIQPGLEHLQGWGINNSSSSPGTSCFFQYPNHICNLLAPSSPAIAVGIVLGWGSSPVAFQAWRQTIPAPKNSPD